MKRVKRITAADSNTRIEVMVRVSGDRFGLSRDEQGSVIEELASGVMRSMTDVRYFHVQLSEIKVR